MRMVRQFILGSSLVLWSFGAVAQDAPTPTVSPVEEPVGAAVPTPTPTQTPAASLADRIAFLLSGYEFFPTRADLDAAGPAGQVAPLLRGFATDLDARPTLRLRAVDALGYYDDPATIELLTRLAQDPPAADLPRKKLRTAGLVRHHAISSLATARAGEAVPVLEQLLAADDVQIVLTVVDALGKHCGAPGRAVLTNLVDSTADAVVRREARRWVNAAAK